MAMSDQFYAAYRTNNFEACREILDAASSGADREERCSITYWRTVILKAEGHFNEALAMLEKGRADFDCTSLFALMKAQLLVCLGRTGQAIDILERAPIVAEHEIYYALTLEAAYYLCALLIKCGKPAPAQLLALIPDDFMTMDDDGKRFVGKSQLLQGAK